VYCSPFRSQATFVAKNRGDEVLDEEGIAAHSGIVFSEVEKFRLAQAKVRGDGWATGGWAGVAKCHLCMWPLPRAITLFPKVYNAITSTQSYDSAPVASEP